MNRTACLRPLRSMAGSTADLPPIPSGRPVILVMGRTPELGRVKSRLARTMGRHAALRLHTAFLQDSLALAQTAARSIKGSAFLAYEGLAPPSEPDLAILPSFPQCSGNLGQRQAHAQDLLFSLGAGAVITMGSDSPNLPVDRLLSAWHERSRADLIVVPAVDGGYIMVSHTRPLPEIYRNVPWGTPGALAAVEKNAASGGLTVRRLASWHDIDDQDDLRRLQQELSLAPDSAPCSARVLDELALGPAA
jgi:rSAM/selenodomain-associated transferase 1